MTHDINLHTALLLTLAGAVGGFLNTVASSGSAVTLPVMIALGLHPMVANTTNRVPVLLGFAAAVWKYHRADQLPWREGFRVSLPLVLGAVLGALSASCLDDMRTGLMTTMAVGMALVVVLCNPSRWLNADQAKRAPESGPLVMCVLFVVGIWAGLIVLDTGIYLLATLVMLAHYPIREANAIKALGIGLVSLLSVIVFTVRGQIDWLWAIPLSVGGIIGSLIGTRFSLGPNAAKWVFWMLVLILGIEAAKLSLRFL
jgi:uncharacterized membrane protein YfcA